MKIILAMGNKLVLQIRQFYEIIYVKYKYDDLE